MRQRIQIAGKPVMHLHRTRSDGLVQEWTVHWGRAPLGVLSDDGEGHCTVATHDARGPEDCTDVYHPLLERRLDLGVAKLLELLSAQSERAAADVHVVRAPGYFEVRR